MIVVFSSYLKAIQLSNQTTLSQNSGDPPSLQKQCQRQKAPKSSKALLFHFQLLFFW